MRLQKLHNRDSRIIANVPNDINQETALNLLGWETLKVQRLKSEAKMMFKILHLLGHRILKNYIKKDYKKNFKNII